MPLDEEIPVEAKGEFFNWVSRFFDGDNERANKTWEGTGYAPPGPGGPRPTGVQLRRYLLKFDWTAKDAKHKGDE